MITSNCMKTNSQCFYNSLNCFLNFIIQIFNVLSMCLSIYGLPNDESQIKFYHKLIIFSIAVSTICMSIKTSLNLEEDVVEHRI